MKNSEEMTCYSPRLTDIINGALCDPGSKRRKRSDDSQFEYIIGFSLDGMKDFQTASDVPWLERSARLSVHNNPYLYPFDETDGIRRLKPTDEHLEIKGMNLSPGKSCEVLYL